MKIDFVGVGEAMEPAVGNTAVLIHSKSLVLVDCGYAVPRDYLTRGLAPDALDALYLTHSHADHTFGLPALLLRMFEDGRKKPLTIIGQPGTQRMVEGIVDLGYSSLRGKFEYELRFMESTTSAEFGGLSFAFAPTNHSVPNYAVRISEGKHAVGISGDGEATPDSIQLFAECDWLVHECFTYDNPRWGHGSALQIMEFAKKLPKLKRLGFVHIHRSEREKRLQEFLGLATDVPFELRVPKQQEIWETDRS